MKYGIVGRSIEKEMPWMSLAMNVKGSKREHTSTRNCQFSSTNTIRNKNIMCSFVRWFRIFPVCSRCTRLVHTQALRSFSHQHRCRIFSIDAQAQRSQSALIHVMVHLFLFFSFPECITYGMCVCAFVALRYILFIFIEFFHFTNDCKAIITIIM